MGSEGSVASSSCTGTFTAPAFEATADAKHVTVERFTWNDARATASGTPSAAASIASNSSSDIPASIALTNPLGAGASFYTIIKNVIMAFLGMVGGLALLVFVYAGILWMTAGSSDRVQKAKDAMKYAVIGLALFAFSYVITSFVINGLTGKIAAPTTPTTPDYAQPSGPNP